MSLLNLQIPGLDLILGGGIHDLARQKGSSPSVSILIRGGPGAGKTLWAAQLATAIARGRSKSIPQDVAYGCIELLPIELAGQLSTFLPREIQVLPFKDRPAACDHVRILSGVLDLGEAGLEQQRLVASIDEFLNQFRKEPTSEIGVLVLDSLSDGYNLGASIPRVLADGVCKLAANRGLSLILLEETTDASPSPWSFAADIVLELGHPAPEGVGGTGFERRLTVVKNRFGRSDSGPHAFAFLNDGLQVFPRPGAYLSIGASDYLLKHLTRQFPSDGWNLKVDAKFALDEFDSFDKCVTAVFGPDSAAVSRVALRLGGGPSKEPTDLFINFGMRDSIGASGNPRGVSLQLGADSYLTGHRLLALFRGMTERLNRIRRVVIGDVHELRSFRERDELRRSIGVIVRLLKDRAIPAVLYETCAESRTGIVSMAPAIADLADMALELGFGPNPKEFSLHVQHLGKFKSRTGLTPSRDQLAED